MAGYGIAGTDVFGVIAALQAVDTTSAGATYTIENWNSVPHAKSSAYAEDSNGDPAAATYYGGVGGLTDTAGQLVASDISYDIVLVSGSADISGIVIGAKGSGYVMSKADINTSNGAWPKIPVAGRNSVAATDTAGMGVWTLPAATINGRKKAQAIGFTTDTGCRLQGSSISVSADDAMQPDSQGNEVAYDIANCILTGGADFVEVTSAIGWTLDTTFGGTSTQEPGSDQANTGYATNSGAFERVLVRA
jgi:hypothetical protein